MKWTSDGISKQKCDEHKRFYLKIFKINRCNLLFTGLFAIFQIASSFFTIIS